MDNRGVTPVVEKLLTIGVVVLFIGSTTAILYGSAVPSYRDAVGAELGERALVSTADQIEESIPPNATAASGRTTVDLPRTIRGDRYEVRVDGHSLVLDHPSQAIGNRVTLALPEHVENVTGTLRSGDSSSVRIETVDDGVAIRVGETT